MNGRLILLLSLFRLAFGGLSAWALPPQQTEAAVTVLNRSGLPITQITDGDRISLRIKQNTLVSQNTTVQFFLDQVTIPVAGCTIPSGQNVCDSVPFFALGWYWGFEGSPAPQRLILAGADPASPAKAPIEVRPRPVVMVHGFISNSTTWQTYTQPQGFLAEIGLAGFAVGDGKAPGVLNTGKIEDPLQRTNSLLENAAILQGYIQGVKQQTGAQMVDLVVHSMGGMISRVYIDHDMGSGSDRDIAQLIMLGSPSLGSDCAVLPAALGWYLPASLEIRSAYARQVLNPQFTHRKGVAFFALAGVPLIEPVSSPCTSVPSDSVVGRDSVNGIPLTLAEVPLLHSSLISSPQVFESFVRPLLQKSPADFVEQPDPPAVTDANPPLQAQFSQAFTGRVHPGETAEVIIPIDVGVSVAGFALFEPTRTLTVTVIGASGNIISLDPVKNGELKINDPASMLHLGYGFNNPKPGQWRVQIHPTERMPADGADYAIVARFVGGAQLLAQADAVVARVGQPVTLTARLVVNGAAIPITSAEARLRTADSNTPARLSLPTAANQIAPSGAAPDGAILVLTLQPAGDSYSAVWIPQQTGLYAVDVTAIAAGVESLPIERSAYLVVQVESPEAVSGKLGRSSLFFAGVALLALCVIGITVIAASWAWIRMSYRRKGAK